MLCGCTVIIGHYIILLSQSIIGTVLSLYIENTELATYQGRGYYFWAVKATNGRFGIDAINI